MLFEVRDLTGQATNKASSKNLRGANLRRPWRPTMILTPSRGQVPDGVSSVGRMKFP